MSAFAARRTRESLHGVVVRLAQTPPGRRQPGGSAVAENSNNAGRWAAGIVIANPGQVTPAFAQWVQRRAWPVLRVLHRPSLCGTENLPAQGPFLLVANHSAGIGAAEIECFIALYLQKVGAQRPLAGFALPLSFRLWPSSWLLRQVGAIPSTYEAARDAIGKGVPLLVFPGGDHETLRPLQEANRVDFGGRVGFLRIAREHGLAIVPMGIAGSHYTAPVLWRANWLATALVLPRLFGQKRWGVTLLGALGALAILAGVDAAWPLRAALAWAWLGTPFTLLPWIPWTIRMRIGAPIAASALFAGGAAEGTDAAWRSALATVEAAVQAQLDRARQDGAGSCQ